MPTQTIFFTGGGSGGHVIPALSLIKEIKSLSQNTVIYYLGRRRGIEKDIITQEVDNYYGIFTGKLRRYFSFKHFTDLFSFLLGFFQSIFILFPYRFQKTVLFSTGGFVSLAPVIASRLLGYIVYIHEQTSRAGLANKIASYFCHKVFISFEKSSSYFPAKKVFYSGYPLRREIEFAKSQSPTFQGKALDNSPKPSILITGGGNGSIFLNIWTYTHLKELSDTFTIFHQVGEAFIEQYKKKYKKKKFSSYHYLFGFSGELISLLQHATVVVTRSGAGIVSELIYLNKPTLFVPLKIAQQNEQYLNALEASELIPANIISEDDFLNSSHLDVLLKLSKSKEKKKNSFIPNNARELLASKIMKKVR